MSIETLKPAFWFPDSLATKATAGFSRSSEVKDGSETSLALVDELASIPGPFKTKLYALYASGVEGYQGKTFSPKQLAAMIFYRNPYKPEDICHWIGGVRTESGIVYGPRFPKKQQLLESLCDTLDSWNPRTFRSIPQDQIQGLREKLELEGAPHQNFSDHELSVYLVANYAQLTFLLIHPFWNRNGRTSEELMLLFQASNSARKLGFNENGRRLTKPSETRMELVNNLALETLISILEKLGVQVAPEEAETRGYELAFQNGNSRRDKVALSVFGPYLYRFIGPLMKNQPLSSYFELFENQIETMVKSVEPENFEQLVDNPQAIKLLAHHLTNGQKTA